MKAKDIEKEMRRIAEEGKELQEKLAVIESLKDCHDNGFDWVVDDYDINVEGAFHITIRCRKSRAVITFGTTNRHPEIQRIPWSWVDGPFKGLTVEEVYEVEDTDPIPQPPLLREEPVEQSGGSYQMVTEPDGSGGYRTKMVAKGEETDADENNED